MNGVPEGTRSFALIVDDPDAPRGTFTHWLAYDIPVTGTELKGTAGKFLANHFGREGYGGPCPPHGGGSRRYYFTVSALDVATLALPGRTRRDLEAAVAGRSLAKARMMGRSSAPASARPHAGDDRGTLLASLTAQNADQ